VPAGTACRQWGKSGGGASPSRGAPHGALSLARGGSLWSGHGSRLRQREWLRWQCATVVTRGRGGAHGNRERSTEPEVVAAGLRGARGGRMAVASSCLAAAVSGNDGDGARTVACCRLSWPRRNLEAWLGGEARDEEQGCSR
jgi:hypothetical protein